MVLEEREADLLKVGLAAASVRSLASARHRRQQERDEDADDGDDDEQLDEREADAPRARRACLNLVVVSHG